MPAITGPTQKRSRIRNIFGKRDMRAEKESPSLRGADVLKYTIGTRSLEKMPVSDLMVWRDKYRAEVYREDAMAALAAGNPFSPKIQIRM